MNFDLQKYAPPVLNLDGWNSKCTTVAGRLVSDFGNYYGSGEELFEDLGTKIAELWEEKDQDPDPKYSWYTELERHCINFWSMDKERDPDLGSGIMTETDVVVVSRHQKGGTAGVTCSLEDALNREWDFDAHFVPAAGVDFRPLKKDNFFLSYLVFDMDTPNHEPLTDHMDWLEDQIKRLEDHTLLGEYCAFYTTNKGFRVIYKPERLLSKDKFFEMYQMYKHHMDLAGVDVDENCKDYGRLYRLPNVVRDGELTSPLANEWTGKTVPYVGLPKVIRNFVEEEGEEGKKFRVPLGSKAVVAQILTSTGGWPKSAGGQLFYLDEDNRPIYLDNATELISWLLGVVDNVNICEKSGFMTKGELYCAIVNQVDRYKSINQFPFYPRNEDSYVLEEFPNYFVGTGKLDKLVDFFSPNSEADRILIKSAILSPLSNFGLRPVFTIDSTSGRGAGKTSLVEIIGRLYGGHISVSPGLIKKGMVGDTANKFLHTEGRRSRVALIDNVTGFFKSSAFAEIVTIKEITGRLPYGKNIVTRQNDLTWYVTSNDANYDKDFISRSLFIFLTNHKKVAGWERTVYSYVDKNRMEILKEIEDLLKKEGNIYDSRTVTRFYDWEMEVLRKCCRDKAEYKLVCKQIERGRDQFDGDDELVGDIMDTLLKYIKDPELNYVIPKKDLWKACDLEMGYYAFTSVVSEAMKQGKIGKLNRREKYNGKLTSKGGKACWIWGEDEEVQPVKMGGFFG